MGRQQRWAPDPAGYRDAKTLLELVGDWRIYLLEAGYGVQAIESC